MNPLIRNATSVFVASMVLLAGLDSSRTAYCAEAPKASSKPLIFSRSSKPQILTMIGLTGVPAEAIIDGQKVMGIFVMKVEPDGQAYAAGVRKGDIFLTVDEKVTSSPVVAQRILMENSGLELDVTYARKTGDKLVIHEGKLLVTAIFGEQMQLTSPGNDSQATYGKVKVKPKEYTNQELAEYMLQLVNNDRSANENLPRLTQSTQLTNMAEKYAEDMIKRDFFSHKNPEGQGMVERAAALGITGHIAENLSCVKGNEDARDQIKKCQALMMNEPANNPMNHRGNLLDKEQKSIGIGVVRLTNGGVIAVQEFSHDELE